MKEIGNRVCKDLVLVLWSSTETSDEKSYCFVANNKVVWGSDDGIRDEHFGIRPVLDI